MKLNGLKELYKSMKQHKIERYKFDFSFQGVKFDVLYFIDEHPNILAFGIKEHNYYFEIPVSKGFEIKPFLDKYNEFCLIMGFKYDPVSPFKTSIFFDEFNKQIPSSASRINIPKPHEIAIYRNNVEEADKIYFKKWLDNSKVGKNVSIVNLEKTCKLLSYEAYLMCESKNISSCWSANPAEEKPFSLPK
jgi:hypothetical protein